MVQGKAAVAKPKVLVSLVEIPKTIIDEARELMQDCYDALAEVNFFPSESLHSAQAST